MIVIVDYGLGNLLSISNMIKRIGFRVEISSSRQVIEKAEKLILPGVGSFDTGINNLKAMGIIDLLNKKVNIDKVPVLGICLGMQLFAKDSEEGTEKGLGWIDSNIVKFNSSIISKKLKIPHMGWNKAYVKSNRLITSNFQEDFRFYFVHSYHMVNNNDNDVVATTNYGYSFTSIAQKDNIIGVQFHPEKSLRFGMQLLKNFVEKY